MNTTLRFALLLSLALPLACPGGGGGDDDDDTATPGPCDGIEPVSGTDVRLEQIGTGLEKPIDIKSTADGTIYVAEQNGRLRVFRPGDDTANTWLDISDRVRGPGAGVGDERGLLGMALHPDFATNGRIFVHYSDNQSDTVISEFGLDSGGEPDPDSERVILTATQPAGNHNGGAIHFGPDGYLYIGLGDGGGAGDTYDNGQREDTLLAKILRIDVDSGDPYGIPSDNPFLGSGVIDEAFVWGVRNPWKWSFDRETGAMWIADVGQNQWEEIDIAEAGDNLGWPCREGFNSYDGCTGDFTDPIFEYGHADGISITGGYVYRGCTMPDLHGQYFFSDFPYFASSPLWSITADGEVGDVWDDNVGILIATFGEDAQGELLTADYDAGVLYRMVPE